MAKLKDIHTQHDAAHAFRSRAIRESNRRRQLTGSYYWIPRPERQGQFELMPFSDQEFGDTSHHTVWNRFVVPYLAQVWGLELQSVRRRMRDCFTALPRGRVIKGENGYSIIHGGNYAGRGWENKIKRQFNIHRSPCELIADQYETILQPDLQRLEKTLLRPTGLVGINPSDVIQLSANGNIEVAEGRQMIDGPFMKKVMVLTDPSAKAVVNLMDKVRDTLGGWISPEGTVVWHRDVADHMFIARAVGINPNKSIAFYFRDFVYDDGEGTTHNNDTAPVIDATAIVSDFTSATITDDTLFQQPIIQGVMKLLEKRREELVEPENDDNWDELMSSLSDSDY